ncbi:MAG: sigma-70 family RNA polymerase sigma factor, partial [Thermoleophilaceae bacterium]|nr:sigma-70 family RNA polymerase sigma factor [Thermoleophilaceae bacterium]
MVHTAQAVKVRHGAADHEARLAHAAGGGDRRAFTTLYAHYERRVFNIAYRTTGSGDDAAKATQEAFLNLLRDLPPAGRDFGPYLFTAVRNAGYDLIEKRRRAESADELPEAAVGGPGEGGDFEAGPEADPELTALLEAREKEIREANLRLRPPQREVLALSELEGMSYDEIADVMDIDRDCVAEDLWRARIDLHDELRGRALASIAAASDECRRAMPLIAMRDDEQLDDGEDADWLLEHLAHCAGCRLGLDAMQEAGASYRAWAPVAVPPLLSEETMARAAELMGGAWSEAGTPTVGHIVDGGIPRGGLAEVAGRTAGAIGAVIIGAGAVAINALDTVRESAAARVPAHRRHRWRDLPARSRLMLLGLVGVLGIAIAGTLLRDGGDGSPKGDRPAAAQRSAPSTEPAAPPKKIRRKRKVSRAPALNRASTATSQSSVAPTPPAVEKRPEPTRRRPRRKPSSKR